MFVAVDEGFQDHPKTLRLCAALGSETAWAHVVNLWRWAMRYAKDGDLSRFQPAELEAAARWRGTSGGLFDALVSSGFVDTDPLRIHDWWEHNGRWIERAESEKKRKAKARLATSGRAQDGRRTGAGQAQAVPRDGARTLPYLSSPLPARPNQALQETEAAATPRAAPLHPEMIAAFASLWTARYGAPYVQGTADGKAVGALIQKLKKTCVDRQTMTGTWNAASERFMSSDEEYLVAAKHPLRLLCSQFSTYTVERQKTTHKNLRGVEEWARKNGVIP